MPAFETPLPYTPQQPFWPESFFFMRVDTLPVHDDSDAEIAAAISTNSSSTFQLSAFNQDLWDNGYWSDCWSDALPAGTDTSLNGPARWDWTINEPAIHQPGKHLWFSDLRQRGAYRQLNPFFSTFLGYDIIATFVEADKHSIMWSESSRELVESIGYRGDRAEAMHVTSWDLDDYEMPRGPDNTIPSGATATALPLGPAQFSYQDLVDCGTTGDLGHMCSFVLDSLRTGFVWPALRGDGLEATGLPSGAIIRLKSNFDVDGLPNAPLKALARTLQKYGMVLMDTGGFPSIQMFNDPRWPNNFGDGEFAIDDFERVDPAGVYSEPWTRRYPLEPPEGTIRIGCSLTSGSVLAKHETPTGQPIGMYRVFESEWGRKATGSTTKWRVTKYVEDAWWANRAIHVSTKTPNWNAVANGNHDAEATTLFTQLRDTRSCIWLTFHHEPENDLNAGLGTATDWRNMQLRMETIRASVGADNVLIVPVLIDETIQNGGGPTWVIDDQDKFPLYGIDFYSNSYQTGPLDLRSNARFQANVSYLTGLGIDICFPEVGGTIGTTGERDPNFYKALINEALDPANRIKAVCWFDSGNNELGGTTSTGPGDAASDPDGEVLAAFHASLIADYSYRGGARRGVSAGTINSMRVTAESIGNPITEYGPHLLYRKASASPTLQRLYRKVGGTWVAHQIRRIGAAIVGDDLYTDIYEDTY
jgi:hypothetical protein